MTWEGDPLSAVEFLIEDLRWARNEPDAPEHRVFHALKVVAEEMRARQPKAPVDALKALQDRVDLLRKSKIAGAYDPGKLRALAEELVGRWTVVRNALVHFSAELQKQGRQT